MQIRSVDESREERQYEAKLIEIRKAIDEGEASGIAKPGVFKRVKKALTGRKPAR